MHPLLALLSSGIRGLQRTELLFTSTKFTFVEVDFTLDLLRYGFSHLLLGHFFERIHLIRQSLEAVSDFSSLETKLTFDFGTDLCFSFSDVDEGFVAHDFLALVQLTLKLRSHFLFLATLERLKTLFHFDLEFEGGFLFEQVKVGFVRKALVAKLCVHL